MQAQKSSSPEIIQPSRGTILKTPRPSFMEGSSSRGIPQNRAAALVKPGSHAVSEIRSVCSIQTAFHQLTGEVTGV